MNDKIIRESQASMTLLDEPSLVENPDAQLLFKEARQRRRRLRIVGSVFAVAVAAAVLVLGLELQGSPGPSQSPRSHPSDSLPVSSPGTVQGRRSSTHRIISE